MWWADLNFEMLKFQMCKDDLVLMLFLLPLAEKFMYKYVQAGTWTLVCYGCPGSRTLFICLKHFQDKKRQQSLYE